MSSEECEEEIRGYANRKYKKVNEKRKRDFLASKEEEIDKLKERIAELEQENENKLDAMEVANDIIVELEAQLEQRKKMRFGLFCYDKEKGRWSFEIQYGDDWVYFDGDRLLFQFMWCRHDRFQCEVVELEDKYLPQGEKGVEEMQPEDSIKYCLGHDTPLESMQCPICSGEKE